jgi:hypothetical protein
MGCLFEATSNRAIHKVEKMGLAARNGAGHAGRLSGETFKSDGRGRVLVQATQERERDTVQ